MKKYVNSIELLPQTEGVERRLELMSDVLDGSSFLPKTVLYKDIDEDFKRWVEEKLKIVSDEGKEFPTMTLYSNQRFSEYSQTWQYTDTNNNLILNFKTINRENNPQFGRIHNGLWNIPGERFYLMKRKKVLDDNGSESFLDLKMKVPVPIDLIYTLSVFTTKYQLINDFNILVNTQFSARQAYINPNGHYMPMTLESINDESQYNIDDRQFYSQSFSIKVMGYIIQESDYKVEEIPLKRSINFSLPKKAKDKMPTVEIEEQDEVLSGDTSFDIASFEDDNCEKMYSHFYYKPINLAITFPVCSNVSRFNIDTDFTVTESTYTNVINGKFKVYVNGEEVSARDGFTVKDGDEIKVIIKRKMIDAESMVVFNGYDKRVVYDDRKDDAELPENETQPIDFLEKTANERME